MRDEPARDAVKRGLLDTFRGAWTDSEYEATFGPAADAVLAALGIPPTATTNEISADIALGDAFRAIFKWSDGSAPDRNEVKIAYDDATRQWVAVTSGAHGFAWGASPAAAIHALNEKLEEADRA